MTKFWKSLSIASAALSVTVAGAAQAAPNNTEILDQLNNYSQEGQADVAQVNSVFQLRDVAPSDWAFDALRNLVEKYNCIVGYPDGTYRGNRPLSRYEFAAGLNSCMQQIEKMVLGGSDVDPADITTLRSLVQEFEAELATLGARVDDLEGRVEFLEDNQFSTTTKLTGEVIFALTDSFGDTNPLDGALNFYAVNPDDTVGPGSPFDGLIPVTTTGFTGTSSTPDFPTTGGVIDAAGTDILFDTTDPKFEGADAYEGFGGAIAYLRDLEDAIEANTDAATLDAVKDEVDAYFDGATSDDDDTETVFQNRVRLTLNTSFTGKDTLVTRLASGNAEALLDASAGGAGLQTFNLGNTGGNDVIIDWLAYYTPLGEKANLFIAANGGIHSDYVKSTYNPYFEDFDGGNGALSVFASESPIYRIGGGVGAALSYDFTEKVGATIGYLADDGSDPSTDNGLFNGEYALLGQIDLNFSEKFGLGLTYVNSYHDGGDAIFDLGGGTPVVGTLFGNYVDTTVEANSFGAQAAFQITDKISLSGFGMYTDADDTDIYSFGAGIAFADLGKEGNVLGIFAGLPPYSSGESGGLLDDDETPFHLEGFYKYQLTDNISITPGLIWLSNPAEGAFGEEDAVVGTLRTTFTF